MKKELKKFPKKLKFKKNNRGMLNLIKNKNIKKTKNWIIIKSISAGLLNWKILNETIKIIKKLIKKKKNKIKIFTNISLNWPITKKPKGTRMGKGKGKVNFDNWFTRISANTVIFKFYGIDKKDIVKKKKTLLSVIPIPCIIL